jgi:hypothetical protein
MYQAGKKKIPDNEEIDFLSALSGTPANYFVLIS